MEQKDKRQQVSVVVIGHVDAGKSTTTGHLIFQLGGIEKRLITKYKKMAENEGKGSFAFAYMLDTLKQERERGVTITCSLSSFKTKKYNVTIIDAPGHKDFLKNMLTGTSQADAAILVISAKEGEFEAGISKDGSTKEHALLAYALGIKQVIVFVNKMDDKTVNYNKDRYDEVVTNTRAFLKKIGFKKERIEFVPVSGWKGDNLTKKCEQMKWYNGPTAVESIDMLGIPKRPVNKPLRIPIQEVYKISGVGTVVSGKIETGTIKPGMLVTIMPSSITAEVKSVEQHRQPLKEAFPGQNVGINLRGVSYKQIKRGAVIGPAGEHAPKSVKQFVSQIMVLNHPKKIRVGYTPVIDCHTAHIPCQIIQIKSKVTKRDRNKIHNPEFIENGDSAVCVMVPKKPISVETYKNFSQLGRFAVRDMQKTVAVGIIKTIIPVETK